MIGRTVAHYRIIEKIAEGGMGVVYKARDTRLDRMVAVKVLPQERLADAERKRRLVQEAKAASALNHPNIVVVYDLASDQDCDFIVMELITGKPLSQCIGSQGLPLPDALRYGVQIAGALAAAHAAGIVHRDLKPGNVMVTDTGRVKVLDFGLAKLTPLAIGEDDSTQTLGPRTEEGRIAGTVTYMSPEQAGGMKVDYRSDLFSFGSLLHEMITGRRAFTGDDTRSILAAILTQEPVPVSKIAPRTPLEVESIVRRCLMKEPAQRFSSAARLCVALEECLERSGKRVGFGVRWRPVLLAIAVVGVLVLTFAVGLLVFRPGWLSFRAEPFEHIKVGRVTTNGKSRLCAISPDGKYLAYAEEDRGEQSLWVRQMTTGSTLQVLAPSVDQYRKLMFSPNGDYLYFVRAPQSRTTPEDELYRIPSLGGIPRKIIGGIAISGLPDGRSLSLVSLSPDGGRLAAVRAGEKDETRLTVMNGDGQEERIVNAHKWPEVFTSLAWSPDGQTLAFGVWTVGGPTTASWFQVPSTGGAPRLVGSMKSTVDSGEGSWFSTRYLFMNLILENVHYWQIYRLSLSSGKGRFITNDPNKYLGISLTSDGTRLYSVQSEHICNIWVTDAAGGEGRQLTSGTNRYDGFSSLSWTPDNEIVYGTSGVELPTVWRTGPDGRGPRQLTLGNSDAPAVSPDGRSVAFIDVDKNLRQRVFRMNADGSNPMRIVEDSPSWWPEWSADGRWIVYTKWASSADGSIWKVSSNGGASVQLTNKASSRPVPSPDGEWIAYFDESGNSARIEVIPFAGGASAQSFDTVGAVPGMAKPRWTPNSKSITYVSTRDGVSNIWIQDLKGGHPRPVTHYQGGLIFNFDWSRDGKRLALARGDMSSDVVVITDLR
jgi:Tol biopolymer transport system component/tRNA A-37 threonylcarbamoyl transferase component Bud32